MNNRLLHKVNVTFSCDRQSDRVLDEDWVDLPPLGIPTINELESDDESTYTDTEIPALECRSGDSISSGDSDGDSWDSESINSIEEEENKYFKFDMRAAYFHQTIDVMRDVNDPSLDTGLDSNGSLSQESISIDGANTLTSYTGGNNMTRYVLTHCTFDKLHDDEEVYHKTFAEVTPENVMAYVSRAANVRGAFSLKPQEQESTRGKGR